VIATYTQTERLLRAHTPLGKDALLLVGFKGHEAVSQLYSFELEVVAENGKEVPFERLLGQPLGVDVLLPSRKRRYFHGICNRVGQGPRLLLHHLLAPDGAAVLAADQARPQPHLPAPYRPPDPQKGVGRVESEL
jgi:hypothetical protein